MGNVSVSKKPAGRVSNPVHSVQSPEPSSKDVVHGIVQVPFSKDTLNNLSTKINESQKVSTPKSQPKKSKSHKQPLEQVDYWQPPPTGSRKIIHPVLRMLLLGTFDPDSPLSRLRKQESNILKRIWKEVLPSLPGIFFRDSSSKN